MERRPLQFLTGYSGFGTITEMLSNNGLQYYDPNIHVYESGLHIPSIFSGHIDHNLIVYGSLVCDSSTVSWGSSVDVMVESGDFVSSSPIEVRNLYISDGFTAPSLNAHGSVFVGQDMQVEGKVRVSNSMAVLGNLSASHVWSKKSLILGNLTTRVFMVSDTFVGGELNVEKLQCAPSLNSKKLVSHNSIVDGYKDRRISVTPLDVRSLAQWEQEIPVSYPLPKYDEKDHDHEVIKSWMLIFGQDNPSSVLRHLQMSVCCGLALVNFFDLRTLHTDDVLEKIHVSLILNDPLNFDIPLEWILGLKLVKKIPAKELSPGDLIAPMGLSFSSPLSRIILSPETGGGLLEQENGVLTWFDNDNLIHVYEPDTI